MSTIRKIPSAEFMELEKKSKDQYYRLLRKHPQLKCKVPGEKGYRVDMNQWEKILKSA